MRNENPEVKIQVGIGEKVVTTSPHIISCLGLGSCVAVTLYDPQRRIGGLAHVMLPDSASINGHYAFYQCADTAIAALLEELCGKGSIRQDMVAKMVGGAQMFSDSEDASQGIGERNTVSIKGILREEGIPLIGEDTGGHHGRSVEFHLDSGKLRVLTVGQEDKEI
jgi:chemotaxis protein CheD